METELKITLNQFDLPVIRAALIEYAKGLRTINEFTIPKSIYRFDLLDQQVDETLREAEKILERIEALIKLPVG